MKSYDELTRVGRIRRMRKIASKALKQFGVVDPKILLMRQAGNTLFRVQSSYLSDNDVPDDIFIKDRYLLRIHEPGYQKPEAIELELSWLAAMREEEKLPVPEPIRAMDGKHLIEITDPCVPGTRLCSLLTWVRGRSVKKNFKPYHLYEQGKLMAKLHNFSVLWEPSLDINKRRFDYDGLFMNDVGSGMPNKDAWAFLSLEHREAFSIVAEEIRDLMNAWGQNREMFGLIHGDLGVDANLLFWQGKPRAIDFDDSGYGYYVFDLAVALEVCKDFPDYEIYRNELLRGYSEYRSLPNKEVEQLELFLAALEVYWNLWATGGTHLYPEYLDEFKERIATTADFVVRFVKKNLEFGKLWKNLGTR